MPHHSRVLARFRGMVLIAMVLSVLVAAGCSGVTTAPDSTLLASGGSPLGSMTIIIYTDLECGACERLHSQVEPELRRLYETTGKAKFEVRLLGVISNDSSRAAQAALQAGDQGKFAEYEDALFKSWSEIGTEAYSVYDLLRLATSLGLDADAMRRGLEAGTKKADLDANKEQAKADGVKVLPSVIIDGHRVEGYQPLDYYVRLLDAKATR